MEPLWRRRTIGAFIVFHLLAVGTWVWPTETPAREALLRVFRPYLLTTGTWQSWSLFAPEPDTANVSLQAVIRFRDGSVKLWTFPGPEGLGWPAQSLMERRRKWRAAVSQDDSAELWPDCCRYLARQYADATNPPRSVTLVKFWQAISPPRPGDWQPLVPGGPLDHRTLLDYDVKPEDLR